MDPLLTPCMNPFKPDFIMWEIIRHCFFLSRWCQIKWSPGLTGTLQIGTDAVKGLNLGRDQHFF